MEAFINDVGLTKIFSPHSRKDFFHMVLMSKLMKILLLKKKLYREIN